jgi:hypothetical protein
VWVTELKLAVRGTILKIKELTVIEQLGRYSARDEDNR